MKQLFIKKASITFLLFFIPFFLLSQTQIGFDIDGEAIQDRSGSSISISSDGSIVAIGANKNDGNGDKSGHVRIYRNNNGSWMQIGADIDGEGIRDESGSSVSLSSDGNIIAIGSTRNLGGGDFAGHVRVFKNNNDVWEQVGSDIDGVAPQGFFGHSVSLSANGSVLVIGAPGVDGINGNDYGRVRIFKNNNNVWEQIGSDIDGESVGDQSGWSVSLSSDGSIVAIGAINNGGNGSFSGHVRVYKNNNGKWEQIGADIDGAKPNDQSGYSVSLSSDGNVIAIGAHENEDNGVNTGHVRVYENINGSWIQRGTDFLGSPGDFFGYSVSLSSDGSIIAIGAIANDNAVTNQLVGYVRVYQYINNNWVKRGIDISGEEDSDNSGYSVSLSSNGGVVAIGAPSNPGNGNGSGHVRVYNLSTVLNTTEFLISKFSIFPNPVTKSFTIKLQDNIQFKKVNIYNSLGQFMKSSKDLTTSVLSFVRGVYLLRIVTDKGTVSKKLVIK